MTALATQACGLPTGFAPDPLIECLDAVMAASSRLVMATLRPADERDLRSAISDAAVIHATVMTRERELADAMAPASDEEQFDETARLLRAWPQDRRGDLAGFGAELGLLVRKRRPSRHGLQQACEALKLTRVHPPVIAEVIGAIDAAEAALHLRGRILAELPGRIARAQAKLPKDRVMPDVQPRATSQSITVAPP